MLRPDEAPESLLGGCRKKIVQDCILSDAKRKCHFVSRSEQRRAARRKAMRRERKRLWREQSRQR